MIWSLLNLLLLQNSFSVVQIYLYKKNKFRYSVDPATNNACISSRLTNPRFIRPEFLKVTIKWIRHKKLLKKSIFFCLLCYMCIVFAI